MAAQPWEPDSTSTSDGMLAAVTRAADVARRWEVETLERTMRWLRQVVADADDEAPGRFLSDMPVGGDGAPPVPETAVAEFAAAMGMTPHAARSYLADAWDLAWRCPEVHRQIIEAGLPVWKARLITSATHGLSAAAAAYVDAQVAPRAAKIGPAALKRLVIRAEALFDPDAAALRATAAAEARQVQSYPSAAATGLVDVLATLDIADADDLEAAIAMVAAELADSPPHSQPDSLAVRRAKALGVIARRQLAAGSPSDEQPVTRVLHTYVHLTADQSGFQPLALVEKGSTLTPVAQIRRWCAQADTKVTITPVLDLVADLTSPGYVPSTALREQVIARDPTCVHPYCQRSARAADLDHTQPFDPNAPPTASPQTRSGNLAPLCRFHHRMKTHAHWRYRHLEPGYYLWHTPRGRRYLRTPSGTIALDNDQGERLHGPTHQFPDTRSA